MTKDDRISRLTLKIGEMRKQAEVLKESNRRLVRVIERMSSVDSSRVRARALTPTP
jgi:hypothetical protein